MSYFHKVVDNVNCSNSGKSCVDGIRNGSCSSHAAALLLAAITNFCLKSEVLWLCLGAVITFAVNNLTYFTVKRRE